MCSYMQIGCSDSTGILSRLLARDFMGQARLGTGKGSAYHSPTRICSLYILT